MIPVHIRKPYLYLLFSLLLVVSLSFAVVQPALASEPAPDPETTEFEIEFMQMMINHHTVAVAEAGLCVKKAVHDDLRGMCRQIIMDQVREIHEMESWLTDWYGVHHLPQIPPEDRQMILHLAMLKGEEFEIEFMQMMIMHHNMAIEMAQTCVSEAGHEKLRGLCQNIIDTQSAEIEQMQTWLCEWYGKCEDM